MSRAVFSQVLIRALDMQNLYNNRASVMLQRVHVSNLDTSVKRVKAHSRKGLVSGKWRIQERR